MTRALINEINTFIEVYDNEKIEQKDELKKSIFFIYLDLNIEFVENEEF